MVYRCLLAVLLCWSGSVTAQGEFEKGWVLNLELAQGLTTRFNTEPDLYLGEIRLDPEYTLIEHHLRGGVAPSLFFNNKKVSFAAGPHLSLKIKTFSISQLNSSLANLQWMVEHLWGTDGQKLAGMGPRLEFGQTLVFSILVHRDYGLNEWRLQAGFGYNFIYHHVPRPILH
jgi:hypothetical protein